MVSKRNRIAEVGRLRTGNGSGRDHRQNAQVANVIADRALAHDPGNVTITRPDTDAIKVSATVFSIIYTLVLKDLAEIEPQLAKYGL